MTDLTPPTMPDDERDHLTFELKTLREQLDAIGQLRIWRNEDGKGFVFAGDLIKVIRPDLADKVVPEGNAPDGTLFLTTYAEHLGVSPEPPTERIDGWFNLTYSNYLVLARALLQSMPDPWQDQFVTLLEQLRDTFAHVKQADSYQVQAGTWVYPSDLTEAQLKAYGWSLPDAPDGADEDAELPEVWYDPDGNEHDGHTASVFVPGEDPVPHYNRGRTRVPFATEATHAEHVSVSPEALPDGRTKVPDTDAAWVVNDGDIYIPDDGPPLRPMPGLRHPGIGGTSR